MRMRSVPPQRRRGFTLIELLLVLIILGIILALVVPTLFGRKEQADRLAAQAQIGLIEGALDNYRLDMGDYPRGDDGIAALYANPEADDTHWRGPYMEEKALRDPWGQSYLYEWPTQRLSTKPAIWSVGRDGQDSTDDDISNWAQLQQ
jgi:general secretion pathway protein G